MEPSAGVPSEASDDLNSHTAVRSGRFRGRSTPLRPRSGGLVEWRGVGAPCESEQLRQRNRFLPKNNPRIAIDGDDRARLQRRNRGQGSEHDAISDISTRNTLSDNVAQQHCGQIHVAPDDDGGDRVEVLAVGLQGVSRRLARPAVGQEGREPLWARNLAVTTPFRAVRHGASCHR